MKKIDSIEPLLILIWKGCNQIKQEFKQEFELKPLLYPVLDKLGLLNKTLTESCFESYSEFISCLLNEIKKDQY